MTLTCIICPNGCELEVDAADGLRVTGNLCPRGIAYAEQEIRNPCRTIASSVLVRGGELPLASVRLNRPVPKARIMDVMAEIRRTEVNAPVRAGTCVIENVLGLGADVVITKSVEKA